MEDGRLKTWGTQHPACLGGKENSLWRSGHVQSQAQCICWGSWSKVTDLIGLRAEDSGGVLAWQPPLWHLCVFGLRAMWANVCFPHTPCPPLPVLNASHRAYNRLLGAGSPCSLCCVDRRPDDHVYAFSEATTCCCKSEAISSCLCSVYFQYLITASGWTICCLLSCGSLYSHKGMFLGLSLGICEHKLWVQRWETTVLSFDGCWPAHSP